MDFKLGDKVTTKVNHSNTGYGSPTGKGFITAMGFANGVSGKLYITVRITNQSYNYNPEDLTLTKTQTLHAYTDSTSEVHWSTKKYSDKDLEAFGYTEASKFNKTIDLE